MALRPAATIPQLNPRQMEYMRRVAQGQSAKQIAYDEGVTEHAVKMVTRTARKRLGAGTNIEALAALGWLRIPE